ncbi:ninein isoform X7 [Xenopus laevis]|uniref:Ninein isoform X7 n=1 Tax=Xenopus laevis TaxID=8355 RepID=A0A8J0TK03_XENLA|nr:ninein isoform X7 [Xenopus laevis]
MDEAEQDQYEARLKELFDSFDATGTGSLDQEELTDLCHMLQLGEVAPSLQHALLQDNPLGRVHFDQFKEALILVLSNSLSNEDAFQEPVSSTEVQPKYIKDGKRYGRRSVPELQDSLEFDEETVIEPEDEGTRSSHVGSRNCEEMWKSEEGDEYEAEGQLRFWNPDDLSASQNVCTTDQEWLEQKLQLVCDDLGITRNDHLNGKKLISICEQYGLKNLDEETLEDMIQNLDQEETMSLQDFFYEVCKNSKPLTPSSSTPYRHLKRHLSMPSYDECGRRTITPSSMVGAVGFRLLSKLDDGTGYGSVEDVIDLWQEEGIENSQAILKALDFNLEGKINLVDLTMILENELLMTKNEVYQAALVSFRSEIRHLLERADQAAREKEKLRSDLEKNEKLKSQMASEVDDHHAEIERQNEYNLRKLDEEYKEKTATLKNELRNERDQILQQTTKQRLELEQELDKAKAEENYLRDRLNLCLKENCRLETELLQTSEKLVEYETLACKLQRSLDNIMREKFGDMDPTCMEFLSQEERLAQMRNEYELQRRELQDRIDELQLELEDYRTQGLRGSRRSLKNSLFDEMDNKNATETDQGIGPEDCPPLNMSIEAEMAIEQMREQHNREVEILTNELQCKTTHCEEQLKEMKSLFEKEKAILKEQFEEEIQKAEVQLQFLQMQHAELEADILKLKEEQYKTECEHQREISNREALFHEQKSLLEEKEAALQKQLTESKQTFLKEKEEFAQKAEKAEKKTETKLLALTGKFEEEKKQLEQSFQEQLDSLTVKQEVHLQNQLTQAKQTLLLEKEEFAQKVEKEANTKVVALTRMSEEEKKQLEQYFQEQIANLTVKQESVLQNQLAQAKHSLLLEKEEFAQKVEKETEARVAALTKKCEEQKIQLEQSFQEEIASITERQQSEKEDRTKVLETHHLELQKERSENKKLKEENVALKSEISTLEDEGELNNQKIKDVQDACEEMWVNLETVQNEKSALQKVAESLSKQLSEVKTRNQHLDSENAELSLKNAKNQADLQDLNRRLVAFLKQKDKKDLTKGLEEWQRDRSLINDELESYRAKVGDIEKELANLKRHNRFLEQENTLLKQEIETKQLSKCSEFTDLKNEISGLLNKNEMMLKEKEALGEELNRCAEKCAKVTHLESKIADLKHEQKSWEQQTHTLKSQLSLSLEKIQSLEESLQSVNLQISRIKSDLRVAQQEKESLKQEVMSLHKQLQTSNAKNQVLEMTLQSSGLQSQQKKMYWDDLEKLMEQEQKLLRQENERLLKEVQNAKSDLAQCREKVRQLESALISVKQQKHQNQSSMVKVLEQEKSSLKRECDHLQKELASANRKISHLSSLERDLDAVKTENDGSRTKHGKFDEQLMDMLHSAPSATFSLSQQQNCATVPREQYLHLQQADRRSQQLQAAMEIRNSNTNSPQALLLEQRTLHADSYRRIGRL